jgi:hypothetical protein
MEDDQEQVWKSLDTWTVRYPLAMLSNFAKAQPPANPPSIQHKPSLSSGCIGTMALWNTYQTMTHCHYKRSTIDISKQ